jgi:hypothetical protein
MFYTKTVAKQTHNKFSKLMGGYFSSLCLLSVLQDLVITVLGKITMKGIQVEMQKKLEPGLKV